MKKYLNLILAVVTILSMLSSIGLAWYANFQSNEADRYESNATALLTKVKTYKDAKGRLVTEAIELRLTIKELKNSKDSTIRYMGHQVEAMGIKLKNVEYITHLNTKARGSGTSSIYYDTVPVFDTNKVYQMIPKSKINDGYLTMYLNILPDSIKYEYTVSDSLYIVGHRERRMLTERGKKRFFLARWVNPDWQYKISAKSTNPNVVVSKILNVHIESRKGLSRQD